MAGYRPLLLAAESLDALVTANPEHFTDVSGRLLLRGANSLTVVDRRARMFTPLGLAPAAPMHDEDVLVLVQQRLRSLALPPSAPPIVHDHFNALVALVIHASFAYDFNAFVQTLTALAHELVLGVRFVELHPGGVPLIRLKTDENAAVEITLFSALAEAMGREGRYPWSKNWRLRDEPSFRPTLGGLVRWAHRRGLFDDWLAQRWARVAGSVRSVELTRHGEQRWVPAEYDSWDQSTQSQWWQTHGHARWERDTADNIAGLRNVLAHPSMHAIASPVDAIRGLEQLLEFIRVLWPENTSQHPNDPD